MAVERYRRFIQLALIGAIFLLVNLLEQTDLAALPWIVWRALVFWIGIGLLGTTKGMHLVTLLALRFSAGLGLSLVYHAFLAYGFLIFCDVRLLIVESAAATILLVAWQALFPEAAECQEILIVGKDSLSEAFLPKLDRPLLGSVGAEYSGIAYLGDLIRFEEIVHRHLPVEVVIGDGAAALPFRVLWQLLMEGISIESSGKLYERVLKRVPIRGLRPKDLVLSRALRANSRVMAIQAVYTNLIGLTLLLALSPVLLCLSLLISLTSKGSVLESVECSGFQKIPFRLFSFRTLRSDGTGVPSFAGSIISRLGLENLPQLINVVRGEMTLFGPAPVRCVSAAWLTDRLPFYGYRFSVKPGVLGWAQVHSRHGNLMGELHQLEYDLYYIKWGSPLLDLEILLRTTGAWLMKLLSRNPITNR